MGGPLGFLGNNVAPNEMLRQNKTKDLAKYIVDLIKTYKSSASADGVVLVKLTHSSSIRFTRAISN